MQWALTAFVLCSVSLLVVTLTMEQGGQALDHRSGVTLSRGRSLLLRFLLAARTIGVTTGRRIGSASRVAGRRAAVLAVATPQLVRTTVRAGVLPRARRLAARVAVRGRDRTRHLRFEECLQLTGPEWEALNPSPRSALSLAPAPASAGWGSRILTVLELVVVAAAAGGAIALALVAVGMKATHRF